MDRAEPSGYILFDADHGSTNNVYVSFRVAVFFSLLTNRTLVIPPAQPMWLVDWGPLGIQQGTQHLVPA